ncbi:MAG: alpha-ketoglutarate decarboxylase [Flavobacteriaceae bacterium]|nr:alpha-ketoglutarate decarboxylase [Flavobacteriaceae bacterium]
MKNITTFFRKSFFLVFFSFFLSANAQLDDIQAPSFWDKVQFGGGIGLNFSNGNFYGALSPQMLYRAHPKVAFGPGINFSYQSNDLQKTTIYGGSLTVLADPLDFLQLSTEFEVLRVHQKLKENNLKDNFWNNALFLGAGLRMQNVVVGARYNVLHHNGKQIYIDAWAPFVRLYF